MSQPERPFTAPVFIGAAFFVLMLAFIEKGLNLVGTSIPIVEVFPRQLLDWAMVLVIFDIALVLRQILEDKLS